MNTTQRIANANFRPCALTARAICTAFGAISGAIVAPRAELPVAKDLDASRALTQILPVLR